MTLPLLRSAMRVAVVLCLTVPATLATPPGQSLHEFVVAPIAQDTLGCFPSDLNSDGRTDLVTFIPDRSLIGILLGNGDGTFRNVPGPPSLGNEFPTRALDVNLDGDPDLILVGYGHIAVWPGNGDGTFRTLIDSQVPELQFGPSFSGVEFGDFDEDGALDVVVSRSNGTGHLIRGQGDGRFATFPTEAPSLSLAIVGDFNNDGHADLLTPANDGTSHLLLGIGNATFPTTLDVPIYSALGYTTTGDIDGDGSLDILSCAFRGDGQRSTLYTAYGNGDGTFRDPISADVPGFDRLNAELADFDGDGFLDVLTVLYCGEAEERPCHWMVFFGNQAATYERVDGYDTNSGDLRVGDFDGDFQPDVVALENNPSSHHLTLRIYLNAHLTIARAVILDKPDHPFRLRLEGSNFDRNGLVFIGESATPWPTSVWKDPRRVVVKGASELEAQFIVGVPTTVRFVNPDGRVASVVVTR